MLALPVTDKVIKKGKPTKTIDVTHLIRRACARFERAGSRRTEGDAPHLMEGICVIAYDPVTGTLCPDLPKPGSGLRWEEFAPNFVAAYEARYGDDGADAEESGESDETGDTP